MVWIGLIWLRIGTSGWLSWTRWWTSGFHKMLGCSRVAAQLAASQEGLSSMSDPSIHLSMALRSFCWALAASQFLNQYTVGRTPWTGDQPVPRPLPTHRTTQTQNKRTQTSMPCSRFRTHESRVRASEDSSCLRLWLTHNVIYPCASSSTMTWQFVGRMRYTSTYS
jgi:hypothetical protein